MRIGIFCTGSNTVPPKTYGGVQAVNYVTSEELIKRGHTVLLFAPHESRTSGKLIEINSGWGEFIEQKNVDTYLAKYIDKLDILLDTSAYSIPGRKWRDLPYINRMGGDTNKKYCKYMDRNIVFPSYSHLKHHSQNDCLCGKKRYKKNCDTPVVYKPVSFPGKVSDLPFSDANLGYFLCLGLVQEYKGTHFAVELARKSNIRLRIIGPIGNHVYFNERIKPFLNDKITYEPAVSFNEKWELLSNAISTIFTTNCEEGGPNVPLESLLTGTPIVAFNKSTITEFVVDGKTGLLCDTIDIMCDRLHELENIKSIDCKEDVLKKFSVKKFVDAYENLFKKVIAGERWI